MTRLRRETLVFPLRLYLLVCLLAAAVFSPTALSFAVALLLLGYLYTWRRPISAVIDVLRDYFVFFAITLLLAPQTGEVFSFVLALPVIFLVDRGLVSAAQSLPCREVRYTRIPTSLSMTLVLIPVASALIAVFFTSLALFLASAAMLLYLGIRATQAVRGLPARPVEAIPVELRIRAGKSDQAEITFIPRTKTGGRLFLRSPYEWLKVSPGDLSFQDEKLSLKVTLTPSLSGPSVLELTGYATDRWGLTQTRFKLETVRLYVIPRARYAQWLANKYLSESRPGNLPLVSDVGVAKTIYGLRSGVEYYGSRLYEPGDSLKNIDWKHSFKYNEMITKEFAEFHGQPAIVLINLAVKDAEEADRLAYKIITTAMSLAHEGIPAALAAYDQQRVTVVTNQLDPRRLVLEALIVARQIVTVANPLRYLSPPDVTRLRADIARLRLVESEPARALLGLLQMEYGNLSRNAALNPCSRALAEAANKVGGQSGVVMVSCHNHDTEALAINEFLLARNDTAVVRV